MGKLVNVVVSESISGKRIARVNVRLHSFYPKDFPLLSFDDGEQYLAQDGGVVTQIMVGEGNTLSTNGVMFEMNIDENISTVDINDRTRQLSDLLVSSISSMTVGVKDEGGRVEQKPLGFSIHGQNLSAADVCSPGGLMSLFVLSASDAFHDAFQRQEGAFPVVYYFDPKALMEVVPYFPSNAEMHNQGLDADAPELAFANVVHFLHYAVEDYVENNSAPEMLINGTVPLDPLFQKWYEARQSYKVTVYHPPKPEPTQTLSHSSGGMSV